MSRHTVHLLGGGVYRLALLIRESDALGPGQGLTTDAQTLPVQLPTAPLQPPVTLVVTAGTPTVSAGGLAAGDT